MKKVPMKIGTFFVLEHTIFAVKMFAFYFLLC